MSTPRTIPPNGCRFCGCTEHHACQTPQGNCAWADDAKTVCTRRYCIAKAVALGIPIRDEAKALIRNMELAVKVASAMLRPEHKVGELCDVNDPDRHIHLLGARVVDFDWHPIPLEESFIQVAFTGAAGDQVEWFSARHVRFHKAATLAAIGDL